MGDMSALIEQYRHRLSVTDFFKMVDSGILAETEHIELIHGTLVNMAPVGSKHAHVVNQLTRFFTLADSEGYLVSTQNPIRLDDLSAPQPDIALLKPGNFLEQLPSAEDVLLIIEVAYSSINYDRDVKLTLYAERSILGVWLWDLTAGELTVYRTPIRGQYREILKPISGEIIRLVMRPNVGWQLSDGKTWSVPY